MDWKSIAIEKLRDHEAKRRALESIPLELAQIESSMTSIRSSRADGTPVKGGGSGYEDRMLGLIVKKQELEDNLDRAQLCVDMVTGALQTLNQEERLILDRFYINAAKGNVDRLCGELCLEQSSVYRRKDAALRKFTIALYGVTES